MSCSNGTECEPAEETSLIHPSKSPPFSSFTDLAPVCEISCLNELEGCEEPAVETPRCSDEKVQPECIDPSACAESEATGKCLDPSWKDRKPVPEANVLMEKDGRLAGLKGAGYLYQDNRGLSRLVAQVPLIVTRLWHHFFMPRGTSKPIVGEPLPTPFRVVADSSGEAYACLLYTSPSPRD